MGTPDEEYFSSINSLERPIGTYLYGRRMYEAMLYWETALSPTSRPGYWTSPTSGSWPTRSCFRKPWPRRQARGPPWRGSSRSRRFGSMKAGATSDLTVGGADLAAQAFRSWPRRRVPLVLLAHREEAANKPLPSHERLDLHLLNEEHFRSGIVHLHYGVPVENSFGPGPPPPSESGQAPKAARSAAPPVPLRIRMTSQRW